MRYVVSEHAYERITLRFGASPRKVGKVARKAWESPEVPEPVAKAATMDHKPKYGGYHVWRQYMGYYFLFEIARHGKLVVCVTCFTPAIAKGLRFVEGTNDVTKRYPIVPF